MGEIEQEENIRGHLVIDFKGNVKKESGESMVSMAGVFLNLVHNAVSMAEEQSFKRVTVSFKEYEYLLGVINQEVHIYLRNNN